MTYKIYSDGSTRGNGSENAIGAWAYAIVDENDELISSNFGVEKGTTNQRMELTAAIRGLEVASISLAAGHRIQLYTDSAYLHNCYKNDWYVNWRANGWRNAKKQPVANQDLWQQLIPYFETFGIDFFKVKGHTDGKTNHEKWNNYVDNLAQGATEKIKMEIENGNSNH